MPILSPTPPRGRAVCYSSGDGDLVSTSHFLPASFGSRYISSYNKHFTDKQFQHSHTQSQKDGFKQFMSTRYNWTIHYYPTEMFLKSSSLVMLGLQKLCSLTTFLPQIWRETLHGGKYKHCPSYQFRGYFYAIWERLQRNWPPVDLLQIVGTVFSQK